MATLKNPLIIFGLVLLFQSCGTNPSAKTQPSSDQNSITLSDKEVTLCDSVKYDKDLAVFIKKQTGTSLQLIPKIDSVTGEALKTLGDGLCVLSKNPDNDYNFVLNHKSKFLEKGYLIFIYSHDWDFKEYLTILKGTDELEIISWRKTDGINYDHDNTDVVKRFKKWKEQNDFWVVALGLDFIQIEFKKKIKNPELFAKEMYEYCPDAIEQGTGDMKTLVQGIKKMNGAYFWWD